MQSNKLNQYDKENNQKVKEVFFILKTIQKLQQHQLKNKKDFKIKIKILKLTHRQKNLKKYIQRQYNITM